MTPRDQEIEALRKQYRVELISKKLDLILDNCFDNSTQEDGG